MNRSLLPACAAAVALFGSVRAYAQDISRPFQLSFGANALSYERTHTSIDGDSATATNTELGPESAGFTVGFGGRASESWLVALSLHGSHSRVTDGRDGTPAVTRSAYAVMPRLEYWFAPGDNVSPYVGATLGLRGSSSSAGPDAKSSTSDFAIGGLAGVRVFAAPGFSIDPNVSLLAIAGSGEAGAAKLDRSGFAFVLGVSLSGWFGTDPPAPAAKAPASAAAPAKAAQAAPAPTESAEPDGTMRSEIYLSDGRQLRVMGRPIAESNTVLVTLLVGTARSTQAPCTDLNVVIDGRKHAIIPGPRPVAGSSAVQWLMSPAALRAIGEAKQSAQLERCGVSSEILPANRGVLGEFYRDFRSTAERYGRRVPEALGD